MAERRGRFSRLFSLALLSTARAFRSVVGNSARSAIGFTIPNGREAGLGHGSAEDDAVWVMLAIENMIGPER